MPPVPSGAALAAARVLAVARERPPTVGGTRLVCVDGPAGSGKTTLATAIAAADASAVVVHLDDLLEGWDGLAGVTSQFDALLEPMTKGEAGAYRRYDWLAGAFAETVSVPAPPLLVIEGVGSGSRSHETWCTVLVWVEVDDAQARLARGMARDGEPMRHHWERWMRDEDEHFARERTRERADVLVDGSGTPPLPLLA